MLEAEKKAALESIKDWNYTDLYEYILPYLVQDHDQINPYLFPEKGNWEVGDIVQYRKTIEFGPQKGTYGRIVEVQEDSWWNGKTDRHYADYQVFWVTPTDKDGVENEYCGIFWTTPKDVVLVRKHD